MSVIISGMKLPETCQGCEFRYAVTYRCQFTSGQTEDYFEKRRYNCPLKSVDGIIEKIGEVVQQERDVNHTDSDYCNGLEDAVEIIKKYCGVRQ